MVQILLYQLIWRVASMGITGLENQAVGEELARVRFLYSPQLINT